MLWVSARRRPNLRVLLLDAIQRNINRIPEQPKVVGRCEVRSYSHDCGLLKSKRFRTKEDDSSLQRARWRCRSGGVGYTAIAMTVHESIRGAGLSFGCGGPYSLSACTLSRDACWVERSC